MTNKLKPMKSKSDLIDLVESFSHSMKNVGFTVDFDSLDEYVSQRCIDLVFEQFKSRIMNFNLEDLVLLRDVIQNCKLTEKIETQLDQQLEPSHKKGKKVKH